MKFKTVIGLLEKARGYATLEKAEFENPCGDRTRPVRFFDGRLVTEENVTEFIRERIRAHHNTWVISNIDTAINHILAAHSHLFETNPMIPDSEYCNLCHNGRNHRLHKRKST
jgi:hypothetical protein